jgi:multisubunit Na+/H+ antiporter MnhG subunit
MIIASWILGILGATLLSLSAIAFFRAKDVFVMLHIIKISNFYIIPLILLAVDLSRFSWISLVKTLVIIALNIVITNLLCYIIARRAIVNNIAPDADFKNVL